MNEQQAIVNLIIEIEGLPLNSKLCPDCLQILPEEVFPVRRNVEVDGVVKSYRKSTCLDCTRARDRRYAAANVVKRTAYDKEWVRRNPEKARAKKRRWAKNNPERSRDNLRRWLEENPHKTQEYYALRRSRIEEGLCPCSATDLRKVLADNYGNHCFYCSGPYKHTDHFVPLAQGGDHCLSNLVPACVSCNSKKNGKLVQEWEGWNGKYPLRLCTAEKIPEGA